MIISLGPQRFINTNHIRETERWPSEEGDGVYLKVYWVGLPDDLSTIYDPEASVRILRALAALAAKDEDFWRWYSTAT
jgi:hypothetical protein